MPQNINNSAGRSPLLRRAGQGRDGPRVDEGVGGEGAGGVEEGGEIARCGRGGGERDYVPDRRHAETAGDVVAALADAVAVPGEDEGDEGAEEEGGCGQQE